VNEWRGARGYPRVGDFTFGARGADFVFGAARERGWSGGVHHFEPIDDEEGETASETMFDLFGDAAGALPIYPLRRALRP